jgi:predicted Na+-dependent transporter
VWALGLVVLSICLCPWVTPGLLGAVGVHLSGPSAIAADQVVGRFSGVVFVVWVLGPTLLGLAAGSAVGASRVGRWSPWLTLTSAGALLLLNYANAATALPQVFGDAGWPVLATALAAAASLPLVGTLSAWPLAMLAGVSRPGRLAWSYALGMKNTGLALGLAGAALGDRPVAVLVILAVTLLQHAVAGGVHALAARRGHHDHSDD